MPRLAPTPAPAVDNLPTTRDKLRKSLLSWYDLHGRALPWRVRGGCADPYRVWLSEVMLQQTNVTAATPYYQRFVSRWPDVQALAEAPREAVLEAWAGLGYYARARNLHAAAQLLAAHGPPRDEAGWRALPGVGVYTAAAIAAIAFGHPANVVDGNIERVMARLFGVDAPLPGARPALRALAAGLVAPARAGDWPQALMDLGATVCTPRAPRCGDCPWREICAGFACGAPETLPRRAPKPRRPERFGVAFRLEHAGVFWLVRRPARGLLAGMAGLPTTEWRASKWTRREALEAAPCAGAWRKAGHVRQVFTHFTLTLDVYAAADAAPAGEGWWGDGRALPSVFAKALAV